MNKNSIKTVSPLKFLSVVALAFSLSFFITGCGTDDGPPKDGGSGTTETAEYLIINGTRYEGADFVSKKFSGSNSTQELRIRLGANYPILVLEHEEDSNGEIVEREYDVNSLGSYFPDGDLYEVGVFYTEGSPPASCQYYGIDGPSTPHGKYELKKVDGKLVSEFGAAQMECVEGNTGDANLTIEGYVIWEEK
ncbi:MAG: hypothetical protein COA58_09880 [Bacteroidetes bacterium]|nr:MAG: hypothetical protein COA58_09880 [Bacteroidota bacterium]